jgi:hypothetical protein
MSGRKSWQEVAWRIAPRFMWWWLRRFGKAVIIVDPAFGKDYTAYMVARHLHGRVNVESVRFHP